MKVHLAMALRASELEVQRAADDAYRVVLYMGSVFGGTVLSYRLPQAAAGFKSFRS